MTRSYLPDNTIVAVVDFDNVLGDYFDVSNYELLISSVNGIIQEIAKFSDGEFYIVRLYGGWYSSGILTKRASDIAQNLGTGTFFPKRRGDKIYRGRVELAVSLNSIPNAIWPDTYTRRKGLSHIRIENEILDQHCIQDRNLCPAHTLRKFTKTKNKMCPVEGCSALNHKAFVVGEQKMVDTMIATDIIDFAVSREVSKVCVFSDDTDLLPPVLYTSMNHPSKIELFIINELSDKFNFLTSSYSLSTTKYEVA